MENPEDLYLTASLRPLWKTTHVTGILFDWCVPLSNKRSIIVIRTFVNLLVLILLVLMAIFQLNHFFQVLTQPDRTISSVAMSVNWIGAIPISMHGLYFFIFKRRSILAFFEQFHTMESQLKSLACLRQAIQKDRTFIYVFQFSTSAVTVGFIFFAAFSYPEQGFFFTHYQVLRDIFTTPFLQLTTVLIYCLTTFFLQMTEIVPILVYYHAGAAQLVIAQQLKNFNPRSVEPTDMLLSIWSRYDQIRKMVKSVNNLFGAITVNQVGMKFSVACTLIFSSLFYTSSHSELTATQLLQVPIALVSSTTIVLIRLMSVVLWSSRLSRASGRLSAATSSLIIDQWKNMSQESRALLLAFKGDQNKRLVACPSGLFRMTPVLLLNMFGLAVSYIIVLYQVQ